MKNVFIFLGLTIAFIVIVGIFTQKLNSGKSNINLPGYTINQNTNKKEVTIAGKSIMVDMAKTSEERAKGLSGRESLSENEGMLFVFGEKIIPGFWMKDMLIPIDIIWISDNKIIQINNDVQPEPNKSDNELTIYTPNQPIDYVLETKANFAQDNGIKIGDEVDLSKI